MIRLTQQELPHIGSSYNFVGADHGEVAMSAFLFRGRTGTGPGPRRDADDDVQVVQSGRGLWVVNDEEFEAGAGEILVIKAGEIHSFRCIGPEPLVQLDVHLSARFIQETL